MVNSKYLTSIKTPKEHMDCAGAFKRKECDRIRMVREMSACMSNTFQLKN